MAVKLVTKINRYIGIAAEIAAIDLTGIPAGSTFFESDTGILKTLNSAGALVSAPSESVQVAGSLPAGTNVIGVIGIDPAANAVQLSGSNVEIGGVSFAVSGGDTLRNTAANKPNADAAHAAIPFCYYHAIDTGAIEVTDGTKWVVI